MTKTLKHKLSLAICIVMMLSMLSVMTFTTTAASVTGTTNQYTYIRMAPYWTAEVVDTVASGTSITIIERDYDYLYVQYVNTGVTKRGYIPLSYTNATGYGWCSHGIFNSGKNNTGTSQDVYYSPNGGWCGSIDSDEGIASNKPLLVLKSQNGFYYIQYVTNTSNTGSEHVKYKRAWIPTSKITLVNKTSSTPIAGKTTYYIKNVATGYYLDLQGYSAGNVDGGNVQLFDFHGGWNQEWILMPQTTTYGSTYVRLKTNQGTEGRVLRVNEKTAVSGNNIDIATSTNTSKELDFLIEPTGDADGSFYIKARCSGNYMVVGVNSNDTGLRGQIYMQYPKNVGYNKWIFEPAYEAGVNYVHWIGDGGYTKLNSTISNGIYAKYDTRDICRTKTIGVMQINFTDLTQSVFNAWNYPNTNIILSADSSSENKLIWSDDKKVTTSGGITNYSFATTTIYDDKTASVVIRLGTFTQYCDDYNINYSNIPAMWSSTLAHELGHTLGLAHTSDSYVTSLMSHGRNRSVITSPGKAEIAGVKKNYSIQ